MPDTTLGSLFGRSPIGPIQEHMQVVNEAAQLLPAFGAACSAGDWITAKDINRQIAKAESQADKLKRSVRRHLPKSLFLPVPRTDLLELVATQDDVANIAKDISGVILGRQMQYPEALQEAMRNLLDACCEAVDLAAASIRELDELLEVGFSGREVKRVEGMIKELEKQEGRTDKQARKVRATLFKMEAELPPVDVMFYYKIIELLAAMADAAERVGQRLQVLMAK